MGTTPVEEEVDISAQIEETRNKLGSRVIVWWLTASGQHILDGHQNMRHLEYSREAPLYWSQERGLVLRDDGLFTTGPNPIGGFGQKGSDFIAIRTQWALFPVPPRSIPSVAERFNVTARSLDLETLFSGPD